MIFMPSLKQRRQGFTLIEILVVLGILAILSAISFSVFSRVRESARTTQCASNLSQIGRALSMYAADYNDVWPLAADPGLRYLGCNIFCFYDVVPNLSTIPLLPEPLNPYLKSKEVWHCPADSGGIPFEFPYHPYNSMYEKYGMSYYYQISPAARHKPYTVLTEPSAIVWDAAFGWHGGRDYKHAQANILFEDGHVKLLTLPQSNGLGGLVAP